MERPDLDGLRLARPDEPDVWLVFCGRRHRVASPAVYVALFNDDADRIIFDFDMETVDPGPELNHGTCLVRDEQTGMIFLATGASASFRVMHVTNYESLLDFGFDMAKVRTVPQIVIDALPRGKSLASAGSRTSVSAFTVAATPCINLSA